ncbi:hypothetical protein KW459_17740 [Vibrio fluvialis]|nr:hypothetical protein [Vibrio fluvialis]MBY7941639.1 hypothetical protein [Vibrio fluvialis]
MITKEYELIEFIDNLMPDADGDIKDQLVEHFVEDKPVDWISYVPIVLKAVEHHFEPKG